VDDAGRLEGRARTACEARRMEWLNSIRGFFHEVLVEFRKVSWPSRREVIGSTTVVIVVVLVLAVFLAAVDVALSRLVGLVLR
jgi:preprotein translocase subunit SecE